MRQLIMLLFIFFTSSSYAISILNFTVPPKSYSASEEREFLDRYIVFSHGQILLDKFDTNPPFQSDFDSYDHVCLLTLTLSLASFQKLPREFSLPEVQFRNEISPYQPQGPQPPSSSYNNGHTYSGYLDFSLASDIEALKLGNGDTLYYFYAGIQCRKTMLSSQYEQDLAQGKLTDDSILKDALGKYLRP